MSPKDKKVNKKYQTLIKYKEKLDLMDSQIKRSNQLIENLLKTLLKLEEYRNKLKK